MSSKPSPKLIGELVVVALKARNLPNREVIGKQDPFCVFRIGDQTKKTKTDYRGGQHPIWDDQVNIPVAEGKTTMAVQVFDEDPKKEDLIGECDIDLKQVFQDGEADDWYKLTYKGRPAGEVYLELTFYSNAAPPAPQAQTIRQPQNQLNGPPNNRPPPSPQAPIPGGYPMAGISPPPHFNGPNIYPPQQQPAPIQGGYSPVQQGYPPVQQGYPPSQQSYPPLQQGYPPRPNPPPPQPQQSSSRPISQQGGLQTPRPPPQISTYQPALATAPSQGFYPSNVPPRAISPPQSQPAPLLSSAYTPAPSSSPAMNSQTAPGFSYPSSYAPSPVGGFVLPHSDSLSQPFGYQPNQTAPFVPPHTSPAANSEVDPYAGQYPPPVPIAPGIGQPSTYNPSHSSGGHNPPPHYI